MRRRRLRRGWAPRRAEWWSLSCPPCVTAAKSAAGGVGGLGRVGLVLAAARGPQLAGLGDDGGRDGRRSLRLGLGVLLCQRLAAAVDGGVLLRVERLDAGVLGQRLGDGGERPVLELHADELAHGVVTPVGERIDTAYESMP